MPALHLYHYLLGILLTMQCLHGTSESAIATLHNAVQHKLPPACIPLPASCCQHALLEHLPVPDSMLTRMQASSTGSMA